MSLQLSSFFNPVHNPTSPEAKARESFKLPKQSSLSSPLNSSHFLLSPEREAWFSKAVLHCSIHRLLSPHSFLQVSGTFSDLNVLVTPSIFSRGIKNTAINNKINTPINMKTNVLDSINSPLPFNNINT